MGACTSVGDLEELQALAWPRLVMVLIWESGYKISVSFFVTLSLK